MKREGFCLISPVKLTTGVTLWTLLMPIYGFQAPNEEFTKESLALPAQLYLGVLNSRSSGGECTGPKHVILHHLYIDKGLGAQPLVALSHTQVPVQVSKDIKYADNQPIVPWGPRYSRSTVKDMRINMGISAAFVCSSSLNIFSTFLAITDLILSMFLCLCTFVSTVLVICHCQRSI